MMNVAVALFLVLSSLVTVEPEVCSPPQEKPPNPPPEDAIVAEHSTHRVKQVLDRARHAKEHAQEAVSEALSKAKDFVPRKTSEVSDVIRAACRISYDFSRTTANKVSSAVTEKVVPTVNQYVPGERGRAKIGRFATSFVRNAAVYGLPEVLEYCVPEDSKQKVKEVLDKAREVKEHAKEAVSEALIKAKDSVGCRTSEVSNKAKDVIGATYQISYDFSRTTATKVSSAVTEKVIPTVNQYVPDERGRAKIGRFATSFIKNAAAYGLPAVLRSWFPGGVPVYYIASRSLRDVKTEDYKEAKTKTKHYKAELKKLQAKVDKLERKLSGGGQNIQDDVKFKRESCVGKNNQANVKFERESNVGKNNQADVKFESGAGSCLNSNAHVKADDTIGMCVTKEFSGMCYDEGT